MNLISMRNSYNQRVIWSAIAILLFALILNISIYRQKAKATLNPSVNEQYLVNLINQERQLQGLKGLTINQQLASAARAKAIDMVNGNYFDHNSPSGKTPWMFIRESGYNYSKAGENLAIGFDSTSAPVSAWMKSPSHRANILQSAYTETGLAEVKVIDQGQLTTIVVQVFGTK